MRFHVSLALKKGAKVSKPAVSAELVASSFDEASEVFGKMYGARYDIGEVVWVIA